MGVHQESLQPKVDRLNPEEVAKSANIASLTGRKIVDRLRGEGKQEVANEVSKAVSEITTAILANKF
ncbi:MAG TPA: hypothetical protein VKC53_02370 [Patescibacteria group bacterium]|nr:hypothetical protein [Patescibacteria group bacterium]